jgi:hypothetical protein
MQEVLQALEACQDVTELLDVLAELQEKSA